MDYLENDTPIEELGLSVRVYNCLKKKNIHTIDQLMHQSKQGFAEIRNLGAKSLEELNNVIESIDDISTGCTSNTINYTWKKKEIAVFCDSDGITRDDIPISKLGLSVRSYNCLSSNGIKFASEILILSEKDLKSMRNMGLKSVNEIINMIKTMSFPIHLTEKSMETDENFVLAHEFFNEIKEQFEEVEEGMVVQAFFNTVKQEDGNLLTKTIIQSGLVFILKNEKFVYLLYSRGYMKKILKKQVYRIISEKENGVVLFSIKLQLPNHLRYVNIIEVILDELIEEKQIECSEFGYKKYENTIEKYVNSIQDERTRDVLALRLDGLTLEQIGVKYEITRERVRQIEKKAIGERGILVEDKYRHVFEQYEFTSETFSHIFSEPQKTYNYLNVVYKNGDEPLEKLLEDTKVPYTIRKRAENIVYKNYVFIQGEHIKKNRSSLVDYIVRSKFVLEGNFDEFLKEYEMLIEELGINEDDKFILDKKSYENKLQLSTYVLWKKNKRLRYYDINEYSAIEIIEALSLEQYEDMEFSTLKLYRDNSQVMNMYDIHDEYELHNLLKKLCTGTNFIDIRFGRMPTIEIGKADRDMQVLNLLLELAPVSIDDISEKYEERYGIRKETVKANFLKCIDEYYYKGMFNIEGEPLPKNDAMILTNILNNDFYFIKDIKKIYARTVEEAKVELINPYNLKLIGFKVNNTYAFKNSYASANDYFIKILMQDDIIDTSILNDEMVRIQGFQLCLAMLKNEYKLLEFNCKKYISIKKLESVGISVDLLKSYCEDVLNHRTNGGYFTMKYLRKTGCNDPFEKFGFEDCFYESVISQDKRFAFRKVGTIMLFKQRSKNITIKDLIEYLIEELISIDIYDFIQLLYDEYGIVWDQYKIMELINNSEMHYDKIMEKIYINYETYFEEV